MTCLKCKHIRPPAGRGLCAKCLKEYRAEHDVERAGTRERAHYQGDWPKIRAEAIARHMAVHGLTASCGHTVTKKSDLTVDHVKARSLEHGVRVICRSCNSRKGNQ
jgi:5-methylcytosine-specific restriction endonuclease McrA